MNDDLISRQAVLDVINLNWEYRRNCIRAIEKLPPVNPQEPKTDVLDKIRAEIEQIADEEQKHDEKWAVGLRYAVKIIDKYRESKVNT